jgi:hypothetical protein
MAGIAALLDQKEAAAQGTLNPLLYSTATSASAVFHDATVATSGVSSCSLSTASMCNNSIPLLSGSGTEAGYQLQTGYDEVTGLGSLDVSAFLNNVSTAPALSSISALPTAVNTGSLTSISITLSSAALTGGAVVTLSSSNSNAFPLPASETLAAGQTSFSFAVQAGTVATSTPVTISALYNGVTKQATVTVNPVGVNPSFTVSGASVNFNAGATTGNTATITITPANGFTGSVALTATVTSSPSGTVDPPTVAFGSTSPVSITSATAGKATMTISTTSSSITACVSANDPTHSIPMQRGKWYTGGGAVLACMLLFGIAPRRRKLRAFLGALLLFVALATGISACGGGSGGSACTPSTNPSTTPGTYTFTVTGTSGSTVQTGTVTLSLTVQ